MKSKEAAFEFHSDSNDMFVQYPMNNEKDDHELMDIIRNRERAEFLIMTEIKNAKSEILMASSSLCYMDHLAQLGLLDSLEQAKSRGAKILILCPEVFANTPGDNDIDQHSKLLSDISRYGQIRNVTGQIKGTVVLVDDARVLSISEEGIDALTIYSDNKSLVNNFGSLFEALWIEQELLQSLIRSKNELVESNEQLKQHDKMQQEFINIAAHELRTPVQPILGMADMLGISISKAEEEEEVRLKKSDVKLIIRNAGRLERLSSAILDVARIEAQSLKIFKQKFSLNELVAETLEDIRTQISNGDAKLVLSQSGQPGLDIEADRERIRQVLSNLLNNAIKFTSPEGNIQVSLETQDDGRHVRVSVRDTGSGIHPDIIERLFTKFASNIESRSGTGLGLYISKAIIDAHGGKIWAENNPEGRGATFSFILPLAS